MTMIKNKSDKGETTTVHKLHASPKFRVCSIPICGIFWFIILWLFVYPLIFVSLRYFNEPVTKDWPYEWPIYYWLVCFVLFTVPLTIIVCLWRIRSQPMLNVEYKRSVEDFESLLTNVYKCNEHKGAYKSFAPKEEYIDCETVAAVTTEKVITVEEKPRRSLFAQVSMDKDKKVSIIDQSLEQQIQEELELKKREEKLISIEDPNLEQDAQKLFPRCSVKLAKVDQVTTRPRPQTLDFRKTDAAVEQATKRYSSPLSPRDLFFQDLIQAAQENMHQTVEEFLDHERLNSEGFPVAEETGAIERCEMGQSPQRAEAVDGCGRLEGVAEIILGPASPKLLKTEASAIVMYINPEDDFPTSDDDVFRK